jgi:hypothetical protein
VASLLATAGCSTPGELGFATLMTEVPASQAAIVPPPGGPAVIAVLQRKYQNGLTQEIALSTASATTGQNAFYVTLSKEQETVSEIDDTLRAPRLNQEIVQKEMEERVPGVDMRTSLLYVQNKYGPFGFAVGRSAAGDNCLYAWQLIEPKEAALFVPGGSISVRLRLCDADATEAQLLRSMYGFTIPAYYRSGSWNPYGAPPAPPAHLGEADAPIFPLGLGASETTVTRQPRAGLRRQGHRAAGCHSGRPCHSRASRRPNSSPRGLSGRASAAHSLRAYHMLHWNDFAQNSFTIAA